MQVRKLLMGLFGIAIAFLTLTVARPALATDDGTIHLQSKCSNVSAWYVNSPDEGNRRPTTGENGLAFEGSDLIHHATSMDLADLKPGGFEASPLPDQASFFSVEVSGSDGKYGTLRWNASENYWEATSQGQQNHDADPAKLADSFPTHLSHHVFSFGVGYTANPPGKVKTTVTQVTFAGETYSLACHPVGHPTGTKSTSHPTKHPTHTSSPATPTSKATVGPGGGGGGGDSGSSGGALAITGPSSTSVVVGTAGALLAVGAGAWFLARRRKVKFSA
jgi:LPXTG-motif cell wall-anchored protein